MTWDDEMIDQLISAYMVHECLWNMSNEHYKNQTQKDLAYDKIDAVMTTHNMDRNEYTKKWYMLRGQFLRECRHEKSSVNTGNVYQSVWKWYIPLQFLKGGSEKKYWNEEMIEELIKSYMPHECLWNISHVHYKDQIKKDTAYKKIDQAMEAHNIDRNEYIRKWYGLRGQFLREFYREKSSLNGSDFYQSAWKWYNHLQFLKGGELTPSQKGETTGDDDNKEEIPSVCAKKKRKVTTEKTLPPNNTLRHKTHLPNNILRHETHLSNNTLQRETHLPNNTLHHETHLPNNTLRHETQHPNNTHSHEIHTPSNTLRPEIHTPSNNLRHDLMENGVVFLDSKSVEERSIAEDEETIFGKMVATTLRKFNPYQKIMARKKIQDMLFDMELQNVSGCDNA